MMPRKGRTGDDSKSPAGLSEGNTDAEDYFAIALTNSGAVLATAAINSSSGST